MKESNKKIIITILLIVIFSLCAIEENMSPGMIILLIMLIIMVMVENSTPKKEISNDTIPDEEEPTHKITESIAIKLSKIGIVDKADFTEKLQTIFKKYLMAVNSRNIKLIYNLSSKELAESTIEMINTYKKSGYRNKIENVEITDPEIISVSKFNGRNTVTLEIRVKLSDYLTDKDDKIVKGNSSRIKERRYQITYMEEDQKHKQNEIKCNNCGALFDNKELKCPYCRTITNNNLKPREWYIVHKKIVENKHV